MANWIVVGSSENYEIARGRKFDMFGFKSSRRRESAEMQPGDRLIFYLTGIMKFGGIAEVTSKVFEDHKIVFKTEKKPGEDYPFRVKTRGVKLLDEDQWLDVKQYASKLQMTKSRGEYWRLAFQGNLHKISDADYKLLEKDIDDASKKRSAAKKPAAIATKKPATTAAKKPATTATKKTAAAPRRATARKPSPKRQPVGARR